MKVKAYTVKTRTGIIVPSWTFETEREAQEFLDEMTERISPHKHYIFPVEIICSNKFL